MLQKVRTTMNNEMNEKKAVTLEDLLMELVKEGKAVRILIPSSPTTNRKMPRKRSCRTSMWMRCLPGSSRIQVCA